MVSGEIVDQAGEGRRLPPGCSAARRHPYSIWRKLQRKSIGFSQLSDIYAFRVIVDTEDDCYRALGVIHRAWPCVPERFKDFISTPKRNNYRSLHTTVVGPRGMRIEMQIRTEAMDRVAEDGVAAHWRYKDQSYGFDAEAAEAAGGRDPLVNLRQLVQVLEHGGDAEDLVEHAKLEMFLDQVFVFTPKGRLISLPRGAMPLDFAYAVHTDVGDTTVGVKINGELRPLRTAADKRRRGRGDPRRQARRPAGLALAGRHRPRPLGHPPPHPPDREGGVRPPRPRLAGADLRARRQGAGRRLAAPGARAVRAWPARTSCSRPSAAAASTPAQVLEAVFPGLKDTETRGGRRAPARSRTARPRGCSCPRRRPDARRLAALRRLLQSGARRPHRRHPASRTAGPDRARHRLPGPGRVRGPRGPVARPAMDARGRAQHRSPPRACAPPSAMRRACSARSAPSSARPAATSSASACTTASRTSSTSTSTSRCRTPAT